MTDQHLSILFQLLILFQVKHFLADFPLQTNYMLFRKTNPGWDFVLPLLSHCLVHSVLTLIIVLIYIPSLWWLGPLDLVLHFIMDRFKSSPKWLGRYNDLGKAHFWWALGFDQMFHHITHLLIIWFMIIKIMEG
ncbi:MAG: DUF3307 domain-containing protein [Bdellovibrionales bacterium]